MTLTSRFSWIIYLNSEMLETIIKHQQFTDNILKMRKIIIIWLIESNCRTETIYFIKLSEH